MITLSSHKKILGACILVVLCMGAGMYGAVSYIFTLNQHSAELSNTVAIDTKKQQDAASTAVVVAGVNSDIVLVDESVLATDGDVTFIEYLETTARAYNLQIVIDSLSLSDDPSLAGTHMNLLNVSFEVKGTWSAVYLFASRVEALPYSMKVASVDILNTKDTSNIDSTKTIPSAGTWQGKISLSVLKRQ